MRYIFLFLIVCFALSAMDKRETPLFFTLGEERHLAEPAAVPDCKVEIQLESRDIQPDGHPRWQGYIISCTQTKELLTQLAADPNNKWDVTQLLMRRRRRVVTDLCSYCAPRVCGVCQEKRIEFIERVFERMSPEAALGRLNFFSYHSLPTE